MNCSQSRTRQHLLTGVCLSPRNWRMSRFTGLLCSRLLQDLSLPRRTMMHIALDRISMAIAAVSSSRVRLHEHTCPQRSRLSAIQSRWQTLISMHACVSLMDMLLSSRRVPLSLSKGALVPSASIHDFVSSLPLVCSRLQITGTRLVEALAERVLDIFQIRISPYIILRDQR